MMSTSIWLRGLIDVAINPSEFFEDLRKNPNWRLPSVALLLAYMIFSFITASPLARYFMELGSLRNSKVPPLGLVKPVIFLMSFVVLLVQQCLTIMVAYCLLWIFQFKLRIIPSLNEDSQRGMLASLVLYSSIITIGMLAVKAFLINYTGDIYASASLVFLAKDAAPTGLLFNLLWKLDFFYIWFVIILAIGLRQVFDCSNLIAYSYSITLAVATTMLFVLLFKGAI